jgi:PadR family transcriptional regulator, regulatory protein PadR
VAEVLPLLKGTLDVLVLKALAWTPMHGFELTRWLADRSGTAWDLDEAAVYQSLYRLEARGLVVAEWGRSEKGRRARYYELTKTGRAELRREAERWRQYAAVVAAILDATPEARPEAR